MLPPHQHPPAYHGKQHLGRRQAYIKRINRYKTPMNTLIARHLERKAAEKKRKDAENSFVKLTYRGVPYCKPCSVNIMYY